MALTRRRIYEIIESSRPDDVASVVFDWAMVSLIVANVAMVVLETVPDLAAAYGHSFHTFDVISVAIFTIEYVARIWVCTEHGPVARQGPFLGRLRYALRPYLIIDFVAFAPFYLTLFMPLIDLRMLRIFRLLRMLKLARYSAGLNSLIRVMVDERRALIAALVVMLGLLIICSTIVYHLEHDAQPDKFSSIPAAMWWGLATLTTVGYGDVVPITPLGKLLGGAMMIFGLGMFAIPVGIVASAFSRDIHQRDFVVSFGMVSNVPAFSHLGPFELEKITRLLQARRMPAGGVVFNLNDRGDAMYFILSGRVAVELPGRGTIELTAGEFFGEMALYHDAPRTARVRCRTNCRLLMLTKEDFHLLTDNDDDFRRKIEDEINVRKRGLEEMLSTDPRA